MKKWTLVIYLNGMNELAPEVWGSVSQVVNTAVCDEINILIQAGIGDRMTVRIMRPDKIWNESDWTGVRRLCITDGEVEIVDELEKVNMADPYQLYQFVRWAASNFPAEHYMLILGGHGYKLVGAMTDYSQEAPYIMGFPGMSNAINMACKELSQKIDILILDTCFINFIEIIYEFGKSEDHAVQNILTYIEGGLLEGLPYDQIIKIMEFSSTDNIATVLKDIISNLNQNLTAFYISHSRLKAIKKLYSQLAAHWQMKEEGHALRKVLNAPAHIKAELKSELASMIIGSNKDLSPGCDLINITTQIPDNKKMIQLYQKLAFNRGNNWPHLLLKDKYCESVIDNNSLELSPVKLRPEAVFKNVYAMNPALTEDIIHTMVKGLFEYKKWKYSLKGDEDDA